MANYATLKAEIQQYIKQNGYNEITGNLLQQELLAMVDSLGTGYQCMGVAVLTPTPTNPGTPDANVFYIASEPGTYANFGNIVINDGEVCLLTYNGTWSKQVTGAATASQLNQLGQEVDGLTLVTDATIPFYGTDGTVYTNTHRKKIIVDVNEGDFFYCELINTSNIYSVAARDSSNNVIPSKSVSGTKRGFYVVPSGVSSICFCSNVENQSIVLTQSGILSSLKLNNDRITTIESKLEDVALKNDVTIKNIFDKSNYIQAYIANNTGAITPESSYRTFKFNLQKGLYFIDTKYSGSQQIMWKYTDSSYATPEKQIIGNETSYYGILPLDAGYYAISCDQTDMSYDFRFIPLLGYTEIKELLSKDVFKMAFAQYEKEDKKYINSSGAISTASAGYYVIKTYIDKAGNYLLKTPSSSSGRTLWKYTDSTYSAGTEIIGGLANPYVSIINLEVGYYAFGWNGDSDGGVLMAEGLFEDIINNSNALQNSLNELYSKGLLDSAFVRGHYIQYSNGSINNNNNYYITDYLEVNKNEKYIAANFGGSSSVAKIAAYDKKKNYLKDYSIAVNEENDLYYNVPDGVSYLRFCCSKKATEPYVKKLNVVDNENYISPSSLVGCDISKVKVSTLTNETKTIDSYPISLKKGNKMSLFANITSLGNGITLGYGGNINYGKYVKVTSTEVIIYRYEGAVVVEETLTHGLTIDTFIKVALRQELEKLVIDIVTLKGTYHYVYNSWGYEIKGKPFVQVDNTTTLTDVELSVTNSDLTCDIWAYGDSYFHFYMSTVMGWLNEWGLTDNILINGFGGANAVDALSDLTLALKQGTPKYIVWCLGMNGDYNVWNKAYIRLKDICKALDITLILCTIPTVRNTSYEDKQEITDAVRASGYRYIDAYKAVGANEDGEWYGNGTDWDYQSTDNVHPSQYGARAIASQWLIDFPEIMKY